jgi:HK97 family phage prohead protease
MDGSCELERRLIGEVPGLVVKQDDNGRTVIRGYAAVFESESQDLGGFVEIVERGAFDDVMRSNPDVFGKYNHERVIGRTTSGTMRLTVDERGLRYEIDPPRSAADVVELIERGDVRGSSFAFRSKPADESWTRDANGRMIRRIKKFSYLGDAGPVDTPAYLATETYVSKRAIEMALAENTKAEEPANEQRADSALVEDSVAAPEAEATAAPEDGAVAAGEEERAAVSLKPTAGMASAARRGLKLHEEGKSGDGLKPETVARANRLARREEMNDDWVREMNAWFARHESASKSPGWDKAGEEKPGFVAWLLWGGNAAKNWSARKVKELEGERDLPTIDEERDIDEESLEPVAPSPSMNDVRSKIASLKATMLRTHLHAK